jgi:subtilisin family serine protease
VHPAHVPLEIEAKAVVLGLCLQAFAAKPEAPVLALGANGALTIANRQAGTSYTYSVSNAGVPSQPETEFPEEGLSLKATGTYNICVAAVDRNREKAYFTCHGSEVDFAAGGVDVFSTWLNNQYAKLSGTSMATPVITGVVALIVGAARAEGRKLTPDEVYDRLVRISVDVDKPGKDDFTGNGIPVFTSQYEAPAAEPPEPEKPERPGKPAEPAAKKTCWLIRLLQRLFRKAK